MSLTFPRLSRRADPLSAKAFGAELDRLGYPAKRTNVGAVRQGIGLLAEASDGW